MTTAYLFHDDSILLMERSLQRTFLPGLWVGVGGHVEPGEYAHLMASCLREIAEETGLCPEDISDLRLRYILLRQRGNGLRQHFVYFGTASTAHVVHRQMNYASLGSGVGGYLLLAATEMSESRR